MFPDHRHTKMSERREQTRNKNDPIKNTSHTQKMWHREESFLLVCVLGTNLVHAAKKIEKMNYICVSHTYRRGVYRR